MISSKITVSFNLQTGFGYHVLFAIIEHREDPAKGVVIAFTTGDKFVPEDQRDWHGEPRSCEAYDIREDFDVLYCLPVDPFKKFLTESHESHLAFY